MKKILSAIALAVILFTVTGCASVNFQPLMNLQGGYIDSSVRMNKVGTATSRVWVGIFGTETFPSVEKVAKDAGILRIATVTYLMQPGVLNIWTDYTTTVTGE